MTHKNVSNVLFDLEEVAMGRQSATTAIITQAIDAITMMQEEIAQLRVELLAKGNGVFTMKDYGSVI